MNVSLCQTIFTTVGAESISAKNATGAEMDSALPYPYNFLIFYDKVLMTLLIYTDLEITLLVPFIDFLDNGSLHFKIQTKAMSSRRSFFSNCSKRWAGPELGHSRVIPFFLSPKLIPRSQILHHRKTSLVSYHFLKNKVLPIVKTENMIFG
ncbi:MAG: hypothetical protein JJV89_05000 [Desulfosarcina sp.]|nr:hypothetical protein [Desulfobacterales bacterium]